MRIPSYNHAATLLVYFLAASCASPLPEAPTARESGSLRHEITYPALGTTFRVVAFCSDGEAAGQAEEVVISRLTRLGEILDLDNPASELSQLHAAAGVRPVRISDELFNLLRDADRFSAHSKGGYDVTAVAYADLWRDAFAAGELPSEERLAHARTLVGRKMLRLDPINRTAHLTHAGVRLDLRNVVPAFASDHVLAALRGAGFASVLVEDGKGHVVVGDPPPDRVRWRITVENAAPKSRERVVRLARQAVASSGTAGDVVQIGDEFYGRVVNPLTGVGTRNLAAVTVVAPRAWQADLLARAAAVVGETDASELLDAMPNVTGFFHYVEGLEIPSNVAPEPAVAPEPTTQPSEEASP